MSMDECNIYTRRFAHLFYIYFKYENIEEKERKREK